MKGSCFDFMYWIMFSQYVLYSKFFLTRAMRHQIIQHKNFLLNEFLCIENQEQEEKAMRNVFILIQCFDEL